MRKGPADDVERAHLRDARGFSPPVHRFSPPPELADVVRRFWLPVWSLPPGEVTVQRVLQYPVCQVVVGHDYAHLVGPCSGLGTKRLSGSGWVVGAMMQPAAGAVLLGGPMTGLRDRTVELEQAERLATPQLVEDVRAVMAPDPADPERQRRAVGIAGAALRALLPVDEEGLLVNAIVEYVEGDSDVQRVGQVCEKFAISERSLQRLLARRVGLTPKWLVQRRRLHEAAERLRRNAAAERPGGCGRVDLAAVAADLGYADQAHFSRDWRAVTGLTPGGFAAEPR